ncbi:MAG: GerMN domain-containing protein [Spirochaetaceae bacterium]|nr:GerMN domain-containing protein [Spirochaetaceae bacterium]
MVRRLVYLLLLGGFAFIQFRHLNQVRRTFIFYSLGDGKPAVENRLLSRSPTEEIALRRYVEEVLWGPVAPDSLPLFSRETRLRSLLYRDKVVYLDISEDAALPLEEAPGGDVFLGLDTLHRGILRNFPAVQEVRLFIQGYEVPVLPGTDERGNGGLFDRLMGGT